MEDIEEALKNQNSRNWASPVPDSVVENSERRSKLWAELTEKYPDDEELKNISMEELSTKNDWFEKYGVKLWGSQ